MASSKPYISLIPILILLSLSLSSTSSQSQSQSPPPSVYDILPQFGLPTGLLPDCVTAYSFAPETGTFSVQLSKTCYIQFDYLVYYEKKITGTLKMGSISNLKGIQVKRFLFWFDVDEIKVDLPPSNSIYFQVGLINKKLSVDQFKTVRSCDSNRLSGSRSWNRIFQLPPPVKDEIPMLLTE